MISQQTVDRLVYTARQAANACFNVAQLNREMTSHEKGTLKQCQIAIDEAIRLVKEP